MRLLSAHRWTRRARYHDGGGAEPSDPEKEDDDTDSNGDNGPEWSTVSGGEPVLRADRRRR